MLPKTKIYYKAKRHYYTSVFPYTIPSGSLLTESEIARYKLDTVFDIDNDFEIVKLQPSKTEKLWYAFRFEK